MGSLSVDEWKQELKDRCTARKLYARQVEHDFHFRNNYSFASAPSRTSRASEAESFHNPDIWARLIGRSNVAQIHIEGISVTALLDTGAQISFISEKYARKRGYSIQPIKKLVDFRGANGIEIDYTGYVEVNLQVPGKSFNRDIVLLVVPHIPYHNFVPVTLGTKTLDLLISSFKSNQELQDLPLAWERVNQVLVTREGLSNNAGYLGLVTTTKNIKISAQSSMVVHGHARVKKGGPGWHCVAETTTKCNLPQGTSLPGNGSQYVTLPSGSQRVGVLVANSTDLPITIKRGTILCQLSVGNEIPKLVTPQSDFNACDVDPIMVDPDQADPSYADLKLLLEDPNLLRVHGQAVNLNGSGQHSDSSGLGFDSCTKAVGVASGLDHMSCTKDKSEHCSTQDASQRTSKHWLLDKLDLSGIEGWSPELQERAKSLFMEHQDSFSKNDMDLGRTDLVKHNIILTDPQPFKDRFRSIPPQLYEEVRAHLKEMLDIGAIRKSNSPWASAVVLVRKKNGKLRFCIDLRKLNARTQKDSYALPRIEQTLDHLKGSKLFSTLDLTSGYWQVEMVESCKQFTAFTVGPLGFYECNLMPFGATNAPATFQRLMEDCLGDLNLNWCIVYLDDVIVYSETPEQHLERLAAVFKRLSKAGLKLKPSKCKFFQTELDYLGHHISADGVSTDPKKVEAVKDWPTPSTVSDVRSFLGFVGYYRRFIKGFSSLAKPLTELTKGLESQCKRTAKKTLVNWGKEQQDAFDSLKEACISSPVLGYPDYSKPFILHTDASTEGLGAVLYQRQEDRMRVIAYASRALSKSESNYAPHKLEFLALKWAVTEKFKDYLYGANTFDCYTDNNPLTYILSSAKLDACGQRWVAELANFNFHLHYKPGPTNIDADALSRIRWPDILSDSEREEKFKHLPQAGMQAVCMGAMVKSGYIDQLACSAQVIQEPVFPSVPVMTQEDWIKAQRADPDICQLAICLKEGAKWHKLKGSSTFMHFVRMRKQLVLKDGIVYRKVRSSKDPRSPMLFQILLPTHLVPAVMEGCHDKVGHQGRDRTLSLIKERFYWHHQSSHVQSYVQGCRMCMKRKAKGQKAPLKPIIVSQPMELVHIDFLQIEPCKGKIEDVLVVTDHFTKYAQAYPCRNQKATTTARVLWEQFIRHYGFPQKIISDQGRNFESQLIKDLCAMAGVEKIRTTPYHPQTNGQCERFNSTLLNMLGTMQPEQKKDWKSYLLTMCHAYNATVHSTTGYSPYFLLFGRHPKLAIDFQMGLTRGGVKHVSKGKFIAKLHSRLREAYHKASQVAQREMNRHKKLYDRKCKGVQLCPGDLCLVKIVAYEGRHKIQNKWRDGEFVVVSQPDTDIPVYVVEPVEGGPQKILHRNLLLPLGIQLQQDCDSISQSKRKHASNPVELSKSSLDLPLDKTNTLGAPSKPGVLIEDSMTVNVSLCSYDSLVKGDHSILNVACRASNSNTIREGHTVRECMDEFDPLYSGDSIIDSHVSHGVSLPKESTVANQCEPLESTAQPLNDTCKAIASCFPEDQTDLLGSVNSDMGNTCDLVEGHDLLDFSQEEKASNSGEDIPCEGPKSESISDSQIPVKHCRPRRLRKPPDRLQIAWPVQVPIEPIQDPFDVLSLPASASDFLIDLGHHDKSFTLHDAAKIFMQS